jgi:hypothetical protein
MKFWYPHNYLHFLDCSDLQLFMSLIQGAELCLAGSESSFSRVVECSTMTVQMHLKLRN